MKVIPEVDWDLMTYGMKLTKGKIKWHNKFQASCRPAMVQFFNPHEDECHHTVLCSYFGDMFVKPKDCCEKCDPSLLESHREAIKEYMLSLTCTGPKRKLLASRLPGSSFKRLPSDLTKCALQKLLIWCHQTWADCVLSLNDLNVTSPEIMLGETDLVAFVSCIHIISTRQHFDFL